MVTTRLQIGENLNVAQVSDIPVIKTYSEADIREPDKRNTSFAKAVQLYGTSEINILFENIFEVNIATQYFNPNIKTQAIYYENEVETFRGYLQLLRITLAPDNNLIYDCNIIGETGNFWTDVGDALLTDLDYSDLDHDYTRDNIINSWDTSIIRNAASEAYAPGNGYYYPLVNKGTILGDETTWRVMDFVPCIYNYEYLKKIFENLGYTWNSSFLESEFFKRQITYPNIDSLTLGQTALDNRQFYVGRTTDYTFYNANGQAVPSTTLDVPFNNESAPYFDPGANFTGTTYTVPNTGTYNICGKLKLKFTITHTNPLAVFSDNILIKILSNNTYVKRNSSNVAVLSRTANGVFNTVTGLSFFNDNFKTYFENGTNFYTQLEISTGDLSLTAGDLMKLTEVFDMQCYRDNSFNPVRFYDAGMALITTGSMNIKIEIVADTNSVFYGLVTNTNVLEGDPLEMINAVPTNIKQRDFVKSIMQQYFLIMQPNKDNPKELIIEPYVDYYDGGVDESWMNILDTSKDVVVNPMSELDAKTYIFKYKSDKDYYNRTFEENFKQPFGTHREVLENDFIKATNTNELIWSPTPNVANYALGIAYPKIYDIDGATIKKITPNIRCLYAIVKTTTGSITFKEEGGSDIVIQNYGYAGHTDDPFNPTIDINFGTPLQVYYSFINAQFTDNNNYNVYHKPYIDQISHRDSKLIFAYLYLDETKIKNFDFRKKYPILGKDKMVTYYRVNKILNYTNSEGSTLCELLKLADVQVFTPTNYDIFDLPSYSTNRVLATPLSTPSRNVTINTEYPVSVVASEDVVVGVDCQFISIIGSSGITVANGVTNVSVVNSSNIEVTSSNTSYVNGVQVSTSTPKVYKALLTQTGTSAPVATVLVNTLSGTPVWSYNSVGDFSLTLASEWTLDKTFIIVPSYGGANDEAIKCQRGDADIIELYTLKAGSAFNGLITNLSILIEVYP